MKKTFRAVKWLTPLPYVEGVFASGSLAQYNCEELSDLDILVIAKSGRIWTTRIFVSVAMSLLNIRRKWFEKIAPDKICLNHYITDKSLKIPYENIYNAQTYINLKPLVLKKSWLLNQFFNSNSWINNYIYLRQSEISKNDYSMPQIKIFWRIISGAGEIILNSRFGDWLEKRLRNYQIKKIKSNPLSKNPSGHVVFSDDQLAFHPDTPEKQIISKYIVNLEKIKSAE